MITEIIKKLIALYSKSICTSKLILKIITFHFLVDSKSKLQRHNLYDPTVSFHTSIRTKQENAYNLVNGLLLIIKALKGEYYITTTCTYVKLGNKSGMASLLGIE